MIDQLVDAKRPWPFIAGCDFGTSEDAFPRRRSRIRKQNGSFSPVNLISGA
jgi:hypothetical protein